MAEPVPLPSLLSMLRPGSPAAAAPKAMTGALALPVDPRELLALRDQLKGQFQMLRTLFEGDAEVTTAQAASDTCCCPTCKTPISRAYFDRNAR